MTWRALSGRLWLAGVDEWRGWLGTELNYKLSSRLNTMGDVLALDTEGHTPVTMLTPVHMGIVQVGLSKWSPVFQATRFCDSEWERDPSACMRSHQAFALARVWFQRLELQYDKLRSSFDFDLNLRLYVELRKGDPGDKWLHVWVLPPQVGSAAHCGATSSNGIYTLVS
jgi:hypothetical protein